MSELKQCKGCAHFIPSKYMSVPYVGGITIPAKCRRSDLVGEGVCTPCETERANESAHACGPAGRYWEAA